MGAVASQMTTFTIVFNCAIQITICVEYRDMLPRPRLVCQEPGLRPIGRSPGVPDKSSRGLGSMSRYSAQILICFIAYIFLFIPLWVWLGTLQDCQYAQCPLQLSNVIRMRLVIRQSTPQHALLRCSWPIWKHYLAFMPQDWRREEFDRYHKAVKLDFESIFQAAWH